MHFIGIGGSGSAIASLLLERGDGGFRLGPPDDAAAQAVQADGAQVVIGHRAESIAGGHVVVRSSAIPPESNPEVQVVLAVSIPGH